MSRLDEIRARLEAATPGPWRYDGMHNEITTPESVDGYWLIVSECRSSPDQVLRQDAERNCFDANFDLIAHMREDMAALLEVVELTGGSLTPQAVADTWRRAADEIREADSMMGANYEERAKAWERLA